VNNNFDVIILYFVGLWIGGAVGVRNDNGIKQKEVYIPVWLNMILFLKNDHRALLGFFAFQISLFIITIISMLGYYYNPFKIHPLAIFYYLMIIPLIILGIYASFVVIRDFLERRKNKRF